LARCGARARGAARTTDLRQAEYIVQRLDAAVISRWDEIAKPVRAKLVERAMRVLDPGETGEFDRQLKKFIKQHAARR
jgi:hypothetical protein